MSESTELLIVENDNVQLQKLTAVLEFVGYSKLSTSNSSDLPDKLSDLSFETVLLGDCGDESSLQQTIDLLRTNKPEVPIIKLLPREVGRQVNRDILNNIFSIVNLPLTYVELTDALHRAHMFNTKKGKGSNLNLDLFLIHFY